jgi:hypothetical protein
MARLLGAAILLMVLLAAAPAGSLKEIIRDFNTGEVTERVEAPSFEETHDPVAEERQATSAEIARLKRIIRNQQQLLLDQQASIERQREEIRRQDRVIRGLELLRRSCQ